MRRGTDFDDYAGAAAAAGPLFEAEEAEVRAQEPGPFDGSAEQPTDDQRAVAEIVWRHKGWKYSIGGAAIAEATKLSVRQVKTVIKELRTKHRCRIGSYHEDPAGYFWVMDGEDAAVAVRGFYSQILEMWQTLSVLDSRDGRRRLWERLGEAL